MSIAKPAVIPKPPPDDLNRANLIIAIQMLTAELRRYNDANDITITIRGEAEFGKATYTNREQREQTEQLHAQLDAPAVGAKTRPSKHRPG